MAQSKSRKLVTGTISAAVIASALAPVAASASTAHITTVYGPSTKTVYQGQSVSLPSTVMVKYSNGKKASVKVKWGKVPTSVGSHKVSGQVAGTTKTASITVVVKADSAKIVSYGNVVNVKAGLVPSPQKVTVTYYSGRTTTTTINLSNVNTSKVGSQMVKTTVAGKAVTVTVNVKAPSVKSATALNGKQIKVVFETGKTVTVDLPYTFKDGSTSSSFWYYGYNYKAISLTTPYVAPTTVSSVSAINGTTSGNLTLDSGNNTVTLQAKDTKGNAITSGITWSSSNDNVASVTSAGKVVAVGSGSATITATDAQGNTATYKVMVAGQASGIKLSAATSNLTANGVSTDTVTATVVDNNGNTVSNYNGNITVSAPTYGTLQDVNGNVLTPTGGTVTVEAVNGVATFLVLAPATGDAGDSDTLTASFLPSGSQNIVTANTTINYVSQSLSKLGLTVASGSATSLNANQGGNSTNLDIQMQDASGTEDTSASGYVTLTLTGPGSFSSSSQVNTETVWVNGDNASVQVYSLQGQTGNISISATGNGITSQNLVIPTVINTAATGLKVTSNQQNGYTIYTVELVDSNGNVVSTNSSDSVTLSDNSGAVNGAVNYYAVSNGKPTTTLPTSSITLTNGVAQFAVETTTSGTAPATLSFSDSNGFTATAPYAFQVGDASKVAYESNSGNLQVGQSKTVSVQLTDNNGTAVKEANQPVVFTLGGANGAGAKLPNGLTSGTYTAYTDNNGVASVTVSVPSSATLSTTLSNAFTVTASYNGVNALNGPLNYSVVNPANYVSKLAWDTSWSKTSVNATTGANTFTVPQVDLENVIDGPATSSDTLEITSSNPDVVALSTAAPSPWTAVSGSTAGSDYEATLSSVSSESTFPVLTGMKAGTSTITIKDISNPDAPAVTETLTVNPGEASDTPDQVLVNGKAISSTNQLALAANQAVSLTIAHTDAGGNPVPTTSNDWVRLSDNGAQGQFKLANGQVISEVEIPSGQSSVTVNYVNPTGQTVSLPSFFTMTDNQAAPDTGTIAFNTSAPTPTVAGTNSEVDATGITDAYGNPYNGKLTFQVLGSHSAGLNTSGTGAGTSSVNVTVTNGNATFYYVSGTPAVTTTSKDTISVSGSTFTISSIQTGAY